MKEEMAVPDKFADLRQQAEEMLRRQPEELREMSPEDIQDLIHELQVHQIELEMQNEELRRTQRELELSRDRYLDLYDFAPVGYFTLSERGLILQANLTAATMLGVERSHLRKQPLSHFILSEDQDSYYLRRRKLFETQEPQVCEMRMVRKEGSQFWARIEAAMALDSEGQAVCRAAMGDITERVRAEWALGERMKELTCLYAVNRDMQEDLSIDELCRRAVEHLVPAMQFPEITVAVIELDGKRFTSGKYTEGLSHGLHAEIRVEGEARGQVWVYYAEDRPFLIPEEQNLVNGVTEALGRWLKHKQAEEALWESEEKYRNVVERANDGICVIQDAIVKFTNPRLAEVAGYTVEELIDTPFTDYVDPDALHEVIDSYKRRLAGEEVPPIYETTIRRKDGNKIYVETNAGTITYQGKPADLVIVRDITERKRAEEALRESEERYRAVVESQTEFIDRWRPDGTLTFVNEACCRYYGKPREELIGHKWMMHVAEEDQERAKAHVEHLMTSLSPANPTATDEHREVAADGSIRWQQWTDRALFGEQGHLVEFQSVGRDITERKRAERLLQALNAAALAMAQALTHDQIFAAVAEEIKKLGFSCAVLLTDESQKRLLAKYFSYEAKVIKAAEKLVGLKAEDLLMPVETVEVYRKVIRERKAVFVENAEEVVQQLLPGPAKRLAGQIVKMLKISKSIDAPLIAEGEVIGLFLVQSDDLTEDDVLAITAFAHQMAAAWRKAQLFEQAQGLATKLKAIARPARQMSALLDLDALVQQVVQSLQEVTGCYNASLFLQEGDALVLAAGTGGYEDGKPPIGYRLALDQGIIGHVAQSGQPMLVPDVRQESRYMAWKGLPYTRSELAVPVKHGDRVLGVMDMQATEPGAFDAADLEALGVLANQLAVALENTLLYQQTQQRLQRITALRDIDMAITASLDLRVTFNVILDQITNQLSVDAADVLLLNPHTQTLEYAAGRGFRIQTLRHTHLRLGDGYAGRAALERCPISIPNLAEAENGLKRSPLLPREDFVAYYAVPLIAKGQVKGVLEIFHRAPLPQEREWLDFLNALAAQAAIAIDNATLFDDLQRSNVELVLAYDTTLEGWARALELRDHDTEGHTRRVTDMTLRLARAMGVSDTELVHIRRGALLHDIGKMGIPDSILQKPDKLTDEEWKIMRQHPVYAYNLLSPIAFLRPALDIPYCHHERWDGTGYPRGLKGEQIPLAARIFAVVDVWDALHSDRPYRPAWPEEKALAYIREQAGKHFDPQVVETFLKLIA
jgi:PAS domain S-box-containing protein